MPRHRLSLRPCTAPLSCSLQHLLKLSLSNLRPSLLQFVSIVLPHIPSLRFGLPAPQPSRRHHAQSLLGSSFHDPGTHHVLESHPERAAPLSRRDDERCHAIVSHCVLALRLMSGVHTAPPSCNLQPLLKLSLLSLRPSLLQFVSIVLPLLNHGNPIFEPVFVFYLFLFCLFFSDRKSLKFVRQCLILFVSSHVLGCHDALFDLCPSIPHSKHVDGSRLRFLALASSKPLLCRLYFFGRPAFCGSSGGYRRRGSCRSLRVYM